jgi:hypothetical protein
MQSQDSIKIKRQKKSDKAKEKYKRNGKYNSKHMRITNDQKHSKQIIDSVKLSNKTTLF